MKIIDEKRFLTIGEVSGIIKRTARTIKNWYEWAEQTEALKELPVMYVNLDKKGTRYFLEDDIPKLELFRDTIDYGKMATYSRTRWGKRNA
jgi:hypothetical protein